MQVMAIQGDTVDSLCWRTYGQTKGMDEMVLEANPGLAALGAILPIGHLVEMPDKPVKANDKKTIQLWD